jgi:mannitol/fructose-specific phosphotransferase system IIA component (Ntr-type)
MNMVSADAVDDDDKKRPFPVIDIPTGVTSPEGIISFLASWLASHGQIASGNLEELVEHILHRESLGSTNIGRGIAVPHAIVSSVNSVAIAIGRLQAPQKWPEGMGEPVGFVCLVISPSGPLYLRALEDLSKAIFSVLAG